MATTLITQVPEVGRADMSNSVTPNPDFSLLICLWFEKPQNELLGTVFSLVS